MDQGRGVECLVGKSGDAIAIADVVLEGGVLPVGFSLGRGVAARYGEDPGVGAAPTKGRC